MSIWPLSDELEKICHLYRLAFPRKSIGGLLGDRLGQGTGSSIEFMDFRNYVPGDDPRHIDWKSYARTDRLHVRLYQKEISPIVEIIVDTSASMAVTPEKEQSTRILVSAFYEWGRKSGARVFVLPCGKTEISPEKELFFDTKIPVEENFSFDLAPVSTLKTQSLRILISDFLFSQDPISELKKISIGSAYIYVIQLLDPWELNPSWVGSLELIDIESGKKQELEMTQNALNTYKEKLNILNETASSYIQGLGFKYMQITASHPQELFNQLLNESLIEVDG